MPSAERGETRKRLAWAYAAALALVTCVAYAQVWNFDFLHYDDPMYVTKNTHVLHGLSFDSIVWAFKTAEPANWAPLTMISHMADTTFFGPEARGPHVVNVLFHVANTLLLFWVLRRMTGAEGRSAFVAALFAVHPVHVESVAWIAERKDVLSTFFGLLALGAYAIYAEKRSVPRYVLVALFFTMSLMAKAMWVTFPFLLLLLDYWPLERFAPQKGKSDPIASRVQWAVLEKVPLLGISIVFSVVTVWAQHGAGAVADTSLQPIVIRAMNAVDAYLQYIVLFFAPHGMAAFYPHLGPAISFWEVAFAAVVLVAVSAALIRLWKTEPYGIVGWCWFLGTLVPVIGIVQVGSQAFADRYTYLPTVGLSIAVVWLACKAASRLRLPGGVLAAAGVAITLAGVALTWIQVGYWRDDEVLWRHALAVTENNPRAHANLGHSLVRREEPESAAEAVTHFTRAAELYPNNPRTFVGLGRALEQLNRPDDAVKAYRKALEIDEMHSNAYVNLGGLLVNMHQYEEGVRMLELGVNLDPGNPEAHNNLGAVYAMRGDFAMAIQHFQEALRLRPGYESAQFNLDRAIQVQRGQQPPQ